MELLSKALNFFLGEFLRDQKLDTDTEALKKYLEQGFFLLEEVSKMVAAIRTLDFKGYAEDTVKLAFQATGMAVLQPWYQSMVESAVANAMTRAGQGQVTGSTLKVLEEIKAFDDQITNSSSNSLVASNVAKETYEGITSAADNLGEFPFGAEKFQQIDFIFLQNTNVPGEWLSLVQEKSEYAGSIAKGVESFYKVAQPVLKYYRLYQAAATLMEAHFLMPGRVGLAAEHIIMPDPLFEKQLQDLELLNAAVMQEYFKLYGLE